MKLLEKINLPKKAYKTTLKDSFLSPGLFSSNAYLRRNTTRNPKYVVKERSTKSRVLIIPMIRSSGSWQTLPQHLHLLLREYLTIISFYKGPKELPYDFSRRINQLLISF